MNRLKQGVLHLIVFSISILSPSCWQSHSESCDGGVDCGGQTDSESGQLGPGNFLWVAEMDSAVQDMRVVVPSPFDDTFIVAGKLNAGVVTFGKGEPNETVFYAERHDGFIAKYNNDGTFVWARIDGCWPDAVSITIGGSIVTTGRFESQCVFGKDEENEIILTTTRAQYNLFVAHYSSAGVLDWAKHDGDPGTLDNTEGESLGRGVATFEDNTFVVVGGLNGTSIFGQGEPNETILETNLATGGIIFPDAFVAHYSETGQLLWAKLLGGTTTSLLCNHIASIPGGDFVVSGSIRSGDEVIFGEGEDNETVLKAHFLARYRLDGKLVWAKNLPDSGVENVGVFQHDLTPQGMVVVYGEYHGSLVFGLGSESETALFMNDNEMFAYFIAKFDQNGNFVEAKSSANENVHNEYVVALPDTSYFSAGGFNEKVVLDPGSASQYVFENNGGSGLFLAGRDNSGSITWVKLAHGNSVVSANNVTLLTDGAAIVIGYFRGEITFGRDELNEIVLVSQEENTIKHYIAKYNL